MRKLLFSAIIIAEVFKVNAQKITTTSNPTIEIDRNLNFKNTITGTPAIFFNDQKIIQSFGTGNLGFGWVAGNSASNGTNNILIGQSAGQYSTSGTTNVYIGHTAGLSANGDQNVGVGAGALAKQTTASSNSAIGYYAGADNIGTGNVLVGNSAGRYNSGGNNLFIGSNAGINNSGSSNLFLGFGAGQNNISGGNNVYLGVGAGSTNTSRLGGVAIGYNAKVEKDWAIVLGDATRADVFVGVGVALPTSNFHSKGTVRLENLPTDAPGGTVYNYIVTDANGNLFRYTGTGPNNARVGVSENANTTILDNWTLKNDYLINKNKKGIIIGEGINTLPKGFGMYVAGGILTEKVKVALKNSNDWADFVFDKNHTRLSLLEVDKFITKYKHLPNVPTSTEMAETGNELHKTDVKLLEKIEELTLYMIELKKENEQVKKVNAKLKNSNTYILKELQSIKSKIK